LLSGYVREAAKNYRSGLRITIALRLVWRANRLFKTLPPRRPLSLYVIHVYARAVRNPKNAVMEEAQPLSLWFDQRIHRIQRTMSRPSSTLFPFLKCAGRHPQF
jgi:hypothetical protein